MASEAQLRRRVVYQGRVQGVGFRATVASVARRYAVVGYVRNQSDGTVELVAEAAPETLTAFLGEIQETMQRYIRDIAVEACESGEALRSFSVRY